MKKILLLIAVLILTLYTSAFVWAAENGVTIGAGEVVATDTGTIAVPVEISNNTGICGSILYVSCDEGLKLKSIDSGEALATLKMTKPGDLTANPIKILWDGTEEDKSNGTLFTLVFEKPASDGSYAINLSYEQKDVFDGDLSPVELTLKNGCIKIKNGEVDTSSDSGEESDIVTVSMTIKRNTANVTFDPQGANETTFYTMNRAGTKAVLNKKLTKRGYTFKDWRLNNKKITTLLEKHLKTDITLTARFVPNNYYVYYKVTKPAKKVKVKGKAKTTKVLYSDEKFVTKGAELSANGYVLKGWTTVKNGTEVMYGVGEELKIDDLLPERGKKIYMYSVWGPAEPVAE